MHRPVSSPPELPGYRFIEPLGSGGFADVFLYEQRLPRRRVAVKVLLAEDLAGDARAQFVAEANLMAQLSAHPYIVTIFHADVAADGRPYFVMEYCSGPSLATRLKQTPFAVDDALRTGVRLAGAVATAHVAGILHRDIKPANVLTNDYGWPALTDFGISSTLDGELPTHTMTIGDVQGTGTGRSAVGMSVPWSPPELFDDDPRPDTRSDVFALAATVHTLLAGRSPFEIAGRSNGTLDLIGRIERGAITPLDRLDVPRSLVEVLRTGMAVRREDRYQSAVEFARALQRVELELGYAATSIEVPTLVEHDPRSDAARGDASAGGPGEEETRARAVQTVHAQAGPRAQAGPTAPTAPTAPSDAEATRARMPQRVDAQPAAEVDERTVVRPASGSAASAQPGVPPAFPAANEATVVRTKTAPLERPRRSRAGLVVGIVAGAVVVAAVVVGIVFSLGTPIDGGTDPTPAPGEDAVVAATVPAPHVEPGVLSADGTIATFEVSHHDAAADDRYRWERADGSGGMQVSEGPEITVDGLAPGQTVCIDVSVQRGSKTSEEVRACTP
ncbi:protein kinase [Agromyces intestinalis]|uniref:non-specific serine/threonine protein kinase n=1 Tax=Agromyces intestinalis TaxID=2592652 RepID=A0A5C1YHM7_9MICO|nr:serine/threonine-protein kinase [Agromyces intestinalis]QEO15694.1 protein kinase [Agromyces intestinalis]